MPVHIYTYTVVHFYGPIVFASFVVPEPELAGAITWGEKLAVGAEFQTASETLVEVAAEDFLGVLFEIWFAVVDENLVVHWLSSPLLSVRVHGCSGDRRHIRWAYMLGNNWDSILPDIDLLVIRRAHKPLAILYESDCIDTSHMFLIGLHDFLSVDIILQDLLVWASGQEYVLFALLRMELYAKRHFPVWEAVYDLSVLGIP